MPLIDAGVKSTRFVSFAEQTPPSLGEVMDWIDQARTKSTAVEEPPAVAGQLYKDRTELEVLDAERILRMPPATAPRLAPPPATAIPLRAPMSPVEAPL